MKEFVLSVNGSAVEIQLQSVLIATDFSPVSEKPLRHALAIARHYGAKVYVAHVVRPLGYLMTGSETLVTATEGAKRDAQQLERELVGNGSLEGLEHEFIVRQGDVWEELHSIIIEKGIDLVVLGTHGRRGIEKVVLGSIAEEVFRQASCHVLTVGPHSYKEDRVEAGGAPRNFLFATDFGEASVRAAPYAISLANRLKAKLIVMHVIPTSLTPEGFGWYTADDVRQMREHARMAILRRLQQLLPAELEPEAPLETEYVVQCGVPSEKILQVALNRQVDLIIIGLRHSTPVGPLAHMPGATAYEVMCGAGCPVLTIRH
jgi:nucleotide-binding universal stress UspA family protein